MPRDTWVRFAIDVESVPRVILSVCEKQSDDLIITTSPAEMYRDTGTIVDRDGVSSRHKAKIKQQRYSVHTSRKSLSRINLIKHTLEVNPGELITMVHYTHAIKVENRFAPLFTRRCPDLSNERYSLKSTQDKIISLGNFDHRIFSLIFSVFVGPRDRIFNFEVDNLNVKQHTFREFTLVIVWSFLSVPSHSSGESLHYATILPRSDDVDLQMIMKEVMRGYDEEGCLALYKENRNQLRISLNYLNLRDIDDFDLPDIYFVFWVVINGFFREGRIETVEWMQHRRHLQIMGLHPIQLL